MEKLHAPVTPEAIRLLESMDFVTIYDAEGNVTHFMERGHYQNCIDKGLIPKGHRTLKQA